MGQENSKATTAVAKNVKFSTKELKAFKKSFKKFDADKSVFRGATFK
jgi:Ca2+-binding EF-hand superfamily protein